MFEFKARETIPPMPLADWYRSSQVDRFHMVKTHRKQNVAEHCYNVMIIAQALASELRVPDGNIVKMALIHDRHESITGDIPTPFKKYISKNVSPDGPCFLDLIKKIDPEYWYLRRDVSFDENVIVEVADLMEAVLFLGSESYDQHGNAVYVHLNNRLDELLDTLDKKQGGGSRWSDAVDAIYDLLEKDTVTDVSNY